FLILFHLTTLSFLFHLMLYLSFCLSHFCACVSLHTDMSLSFCHLTAFTLFHFSTLSLSLSLSLRSLSLAFDPLRSPTVNTTLKSLGALYRRQGKLEAAETL